MSQAAQPSSSGFTTDVDPVNLIVIAGLTAVLFAGGLTLTEFAELGLDIDFKPFFVVYAVIVFVPWGTPTVAAALGATLAEGTLDIVEGAAADDPFGWVGYFLGFTAAGWIFGDDTSTTSKLALGAVVGAFVQYAVEGLYLFAIGAEPGTLFGTEFSGALVIYAVSVIGNTVTHGVILGAIPLIPTVQSLKGRAGRLFPNAGSTNRSAD